MIDGEALDVETALLAGGLESEEARRVPGGHADRRAAHAAAEPRRPRGGHWQPRRGRAGRLLATLTTADRRRRRVLRAIEANPGKSDREVARLAGVDRKTVAPTRERGELPAADAEFRSEGDGDG